MRDQLTHDMFSWKLAETKDNRRYKSLQVKFVIKIVNLIATQNLCFCLKQNAILLQQQAL